MGVTLKPARAHHYTKTEISSCKNQQCIGLKVPPLQFIRTILYTLPDISSHETCTFSLEQKITDFLPVY